MGVPLFLCEALYSPSSCAAGSFASFLRHLARSCRIHFAFDVVVHKLTIAEVAKSELDQASTVRFESTPATCTGGEIYPDGDSLDVAAQPLAPREM